MKGMLAHPELGALPIADEQRIEDIPHILAELVAMLESGSAEILQSTLHGAESEAGSDINWAIQRHCSRPMCGFWRRPSTM